MSISSRTSSPTSKVQSPIEGSVSKPLLPDKSSMHSELLERMTPDWLIDATSPRRAAIKDSATRLPDWYRHASGAQQQALRECFNASFISQTRLDQAMSALHDAETFAGPILTKALKDRFSIDVDVNKTWVCLRRPLEVGVLEVEITSFEVLKLSLLQAALHNFEASECEEGAFHRDSGFVVETSTPGTFRDVALDMTVRQFLSLCRTLDIGAQYQTCVNGFFQPADTQAQANLREQFIDSQKTAMRAAAELALLKKDIEPQDYSMILSVIGGEVHPRMGDRQVWFRDLILMKRRMTGCVVFSISEQYRYTSDFIVYIPHDPEHPLKRYTSAQLRDEFKRQFTAGNSRSASDGKPTAHQRFFSQFVAYADRPYYFSQFTRKAADSPSDPLHSIWVKVARYIPPASTFVGIKELPPETQGKREPVEDPYLDPMGTTRKDVAGIWSANTDLWTYLYEQNRAKVIADARSHAVPSADVDAKVRAEKLNHLLEIGMLGLNMVSMFVPVLGEIMLTVMAGQLLYESFEGVIEWSEGDRVAAKAHLVDVAENLALMAVMAGGGKVLGKRVRVAPEPMIEGLDAIKRPDGATRLWKPDLKAYESSVVLDDEIAPNALGQFRANRRTYIRHAGKVYEITFDSSVRKWRIKHPSDTGAWRPILEHNGHGAWRHTLERPLKWDRLTLLRRMGHATEALTDEQLLTIADASGISDNALRKMHLDHLPPPPGLADLLSAFEAGPGSTEAGKGPVAMLQRACPGLSESAAHRVLLDANAEELARWQATRRIPLNMLEEARWYARQGRVNRAFAGLPLERMASADSRWLALHSLEKLPGWSDSVRLEVRDGHVEGPLIDGIGSETADTRKYVVKKGPAYQAFDERGEALNGIPRDGDNFYSSIMHALPDEARQALGVPHVAQGSQLRTAIIDHAFAHRAELAQSLEARTDKHATFKPPVRVNERLVGYYASGRGQGINPSLATRVRDVYPALTEQQANGFVLAQLRAGKTDAQIYGLLQARLREWEALETTLDHWVGEPSSGSALERMLGGKASVAQSLKDSWRNSPLAAEHARFTLLDLTCDEALPALSADFSHVRDLYVRGRCITDANADALLGNFPRLRKLRITATGNQFSNVPEVIGRMPELTDLNLYSSAPYAADMPSRLGALTRLEYLNVHCSGFAPIALDVSQLRNLRLLEVLAPSLFEWPAGVLDLPRLERLNLKGTGIRTLPDGIFSGHEKLWSGLSLDWSNFLRENFRPAYEYAKRQSPHRVDLETMVSDYSKGELRRLGDGSNENYEALLTQFVEQWQDAEARYRAIEALSEQHHVLNRNLNDWSYRVFKVPTAINEMTGRTLAANSLRACWRNGVFKRYGATVNASVLDLPNLGLSDFPELPAGAFQEVRTLYLRGSKAPAAQIRGFISGFSGLQALDLRSCGLTEIPIGPGDLGKLTQLDLSSNGIVVDPGVQQGLDGLQTLEYLDLSSNPLNTLDLSAMTHLKALNLRATGLREWPAGAQSLPELTWLDLRDSRISELPVAVLENEVLLKTNLGGSPLTPQAGAMLRTAWQRTELARGLPEGTLQRFDMEPIPLAFPPPESGFSIAQHLLVLPEVPAGEGGEVLTKRLQRLKPTLADDEALQALEQMRERGATEVQISERLAGWEQSFEALIRQLNGWIFTRGVRGTGWTTSSSIRRLGALRILECWREGLAGVERVADAVLDLSGLQLGDLPEMPTTFEHVGRLNLTGVVLTRAGSDGFLTAFTRLKTLELNGNGLEAIPEPVQHMGTLERLELTSNRLSDAEHLYASLSNLERLNRLDLGYNELDSFDLDIFEALVTLDLRNNYLTQWPGGVLDAAHLRVLNLSGNYITSVPAQVLDGNHNVLMIGIDLSDNNLALESLERLRAYRDSGARDTVLGISRTELDEALDDAHDQSDSIESDEELPEVEPDSAQKAPWLSNLTPEELAGKSRIWDQLAAEPDNAAFFHLLSRLQDTQEFRVANADLTRRVWTVMEAAASNSELREVLFASSATHGTCVDGRILTFSGLESKVFTHNALLDMPPGGLSVKGQALLKLSRQLFRLDRIDDLATKAAANTGEDEAEVRLGYRIGLTSGWDDGLTLPGQPKHMTYASGVTRQQLVDARVEVGNAERSDGFFEDLIQRDYWVDYLKEKYPEEFRALDEAQSQAGEDDGADSADDGAFLNLLFEQAAARNAKMIELSRKEVLEQAGGEPQPGTSARNS
ncbi:putative E3 ubiquitin-protein ligase ipaH7.8 [Pseudomonas sp. ACN8]|uniref:NEL-type E3 ubiquitin ligase domain-containing protein n=1 Tax=Pseudomonas sp. ACN8 TaxID=1920428 RepID=UPI000BB3D715|nr:NEL-type E3 ubiquitin ligase domain-containing protein [Pseudomonas sp. ACN8]PBJ27979.1 putative E3 ubiquitin-protein ligase ipaH7.8 [Pseudomonas sp. ACN8]